MHDEPHMLLEHYRTLNDATLLAMVRSGNLTARALALAQQELCDRGWQPADFAAPAPVADAPPAWQTVASYLDPTAAQIVLARLAAEGIPAQLVDAQLAQTYSLIAVAIGGVRLQVAAERLADARAVLQAIEQGAYLLDDDSATLR